jgi:hypothetical protein
LAGRLPCKGKVINRGLPTRSQCGSRLSYCFIHDVVAERAEFSEQGEEPPKRRLQPGLAALQSLVPRPFFDELMVQTHVVGQQERCAVGQFQSVAALI